MCVFRGYRSLNIASTHQPRTHSHCSLIIAYRHAHHHKHQHHHRIIMFRHVKILCPSMALSQQRSRFFMTYVRCLSHSYLRILPHWLLFHLLSDRFYCLLKDRWVLPPFPSQRITQSRSITVYLCLCLCSLVDVQITIPPLPLPSCCFLVLSLSSLS